jgi:hypothetical protein
MTDALVSKEKGGTEMRNETRISIIAKRGF